MKKTALLAVITLASLFLGLSGSAFAVVTTFSPAPSVVNPVTNDLFVVNNGAASPTITRYAWNSTTHTWATSGTAATLTSGSKCYGLEISSDGTKLYVSMAKGLSSAIKVYTLSGWPATVTDLTGASWSAASSPAGLIIAPNGKLYVADKGIGRLLVFNTATNAYESQITDHLSGQANLVDLAVTPADGSGNFKLFVTQKTDAGAIFVFDQSGTWIRTLDQATYTDLSYPLYAEFVGNKLYVSVNGNGGSDVDILVFNSDGTALTGKVKSGVIGEFGWTPFDFTADGNWLIFKKANNAAETNNTIYKVQVSTITAGGVTAATAVNSVIASDGLAVVTYRADAATTQNIVALGDSRTGNKAYYNLGISNGVSLPTSLQQTEYNGTVIPAFGIVRSDSRVKFSATVADPNSDQVKGRFEYRIVPVSDSTPYSTIESSFVATGTSVTITTPALADGLYEWRAQTVDTNGNVSNPVYFGGGSMNTDFDLEVPPAVPTGLTATASTSQIALDWANNTEGDLAGYNVYRSTSATGTYNKVNTSGLVASSQYTNTGLANDGATYYYKVTAVDNSGNESAKSSSANATMPDTTAPATPTGLTATASTSQIALDWGDVSASDLAGYNVYRSTSASGTYTKINGSLVTSSQYTNTGLANDGATYYYKVTAVDNTGNESSQSNSASATMPDTTAPAVPTGLTATASSGQIALDWGDVSAADLAGYNVYRSTSASGTFTKINTSGLVTSSQYTNTGLANDGQTYYYKVTAVDNTGNESAQSSSANATMPDTTAPAVPTGLTATASSGQIALDWGDVSAADLAGYNVYRSTSASGTFTKINTSGLVTSSQYTNTGLANDGQTYYYKVTAVDTTGNESAKSTAASTTMPDTTVPTAPTGLTATASSRRVTLDWADNPAVERVRGYYIYRSTSSAGPFTKVTETLAASSAFIDLFLSDDGTTYHYYVTAVDDASPANESAPSAIVNATLPDAIAPYDPTIALKDRTSTSLYYTNEQIVSVEITSDDPPGAVVAWLLSDTGSARPALDDPRWVTSKPTEFTFSNSANETKTVYVWAKDAAGNINPGPRSASIVFDSIAPDSRLNLNVLPTFGISRVNSFTINWTNPADRSGIASAYYKIGSPPTSGTDGTNTTNKPIVLSAPAVGQYTVYIWLVDRAENIGGFDSTQITFDDVPPVFTGGIDGPSAAAILQDCVFTWEAARDDHSGLEPQYNYFYSFDQIPDSDPLITRGTNDTTVTRRPVTAGNWYLHVAAQDLAGNRTIQHSGPVAVFDAPLVFRVVPNSAMIGSTVTIEGQHLNASGLAVTIGTTVVPAGNVAIVDDSHVTVVVPSLIDGTYHVTVSTAGGWTTLFNGLTITSLDTFPPGPVSNFTAEAAPAGNAINLSWTNPTDSDLAGVRIIRTPGPSADPLHDPTGVTVFNGTGTRTTDTNGLDPAEDYYYYAFPYDEVPNYGSPAQAGPVSPLTPGPRDLVINPTEANRGEPLTVTITGTNLGTTPTVILARTGEENIPAVVTVNPDGSISANFGTLPAEMQTGIWTLLVTNDVPATSAVPFTINAGGIVTVTSVSIETIADGSGVTISWTTDPANSPVDIYRLHTNFSTKEADWPNDPSRNIIGSSSPDYANPIGNMAITYFKVVPANTPKTAIDFSTMVVGRYDIPVTEGFNFVSLPLLTRENSLSSILGSQLTGDNIPPLADKVYAFRADKSGYHQAWLNQTENKWIDPDTGIESTMTIDPDKGYIVELAPGHTFDVITVVGAVPEQPRGPIQITPGFNLVGTTYPVQVALANAGVAGSGASAGLIPPLSCKVHEYKTDKTGFNQAWLSQTENKWLDADAGGDTPINLNPGKAYWIEEPGTFDWSYPRPY